MKRTFQATLLAWVVMMQSPDHPDLWLKTPWIFATLPACETWLTQEAAAAKASGFAAKRPYKCWPA